MNFTQLCSRGRVLSSTSIKVISSHMLYLSYFDGTMEGIKNLIELFIKNGNQLSYARAVIATLRRHYKRTHLNWQDPMMLVENKNYISNAYKILDKLNSDKDYRVYDDDGKAIQHDKIPPRIIPREKTLNREKLDVLLKHIYNLLNTKFDRIDVKYLKPISNIENLGLGIKKTGTNTELEKYNLYMFCILFICLYYSAARFNEIAQMRLESFEILATTGSATMYGKTGQTVVTIPDGIRPFLINYLVVIKHLYGNNDNNKAFPTNEGVLRNILKELYEGIFNENKPTGIGFGILRKNQAARLYNLNPLSAQLALNHSNISTTEHKYMKHAIGAQGLVQANINKLYTEDAGACLHGDN